MKKRTGETFATISGILVTLSCHVNAELPENYLNRWDNPAVKKRIEEGIEKNRKSDATLTVVDSEGKPVAGAELKITQQSHEFLFGCNLFVLGQLETPELNRRYEKSFTQLFNFATLPFYWGDLEPEQGKPRYIIDLIKQVVTLSIRTVEIVDSLPKLRFDEHGTHVANSSSA